MLHDDPARVARQALRRSRGNAYPVLEDGLSGLIRGGDVDHGLVALSGRARIDPMIERRLRDEREGVRALLLHGRRVLGRIRRVRRGTGLLVQRFLE